MGCFDDVPLENIEQCVNEENTAGVIETEVYVAIASQIDNCPKPTPLGTANASLKDFATITEDITFLESKGFFKLTVQVDSGEVKDELVGPRGNKKTKSMFDFFLPNTTAKNIGFVDQYKNVPCVFVVKEKSGRKRRIGSKEIPIYFDEGSSTSGKVGEDDNGWQLSVSAISKNSAPIYEGNIALPA